MMAMIMLMGIVVTNAILILDYANMRIKQGRTVKEALLEACPIKLKPILMLNLAIILGMLPMALGIGGAGREFRQAMGIVSIGGLIMATVLSFFVIPALFYVTTRSNRRIVDQRVKSEDRRKRDGDRREHRVELKLPDDIVEES